ncbi:MAG: methionyl-tRNA formyltransferase [Georgfuchsia sp.]
MRIIFAGTPQFAARALAAILAAGHDVPLVLTQPDRPAGRGMKLQASPVKQLALQNGIMVFQPERLKAPVTHEPILNAAADIMVVAAYGLILPQAVLDIPRQGCLNIHASLLPRWRGAAPIQRAIEAGDAATGVTIMQMEAGLDTGPMLLKKSLPIADDDTATSLLDKLTDLGAIMIVEALSQLVRLVPEVQPEAGVTYAHKISKAESVVNWADEAATLSRKIRALNPFPGMVASLRGTPIKLWQAMPDIASGVPGTILAADQKGIVVATGSGAIRITHLQKPGGKRLSVAEFLSGFALSVGDCFDIAEA